MTDPLRPNTTHVPPREIEIVHPDGRREIVAVETIIASRWERLTRAERAQAEHPER